MSNLKLHSLFSEHMVLQQGITVPVWGWGDEGATVTVQTQGQNVTATVKAGVWRADLAPLAAGGPYTFSVSDGSTCVEFSDVLVGEVWVCGGQSNMEWPLWASAYANNHIPMATQKTIRFFNEATNAQDAPLDNLSASWTPCTPDTARDFSAVGYHFARHLTQKLRVPVGLVSLCQGGTVAETWTTPETLKSNPLYQSIYDAYEKACEAWPEANRIYQEQLEAYQTKLKEAQATDGPLPDPVFEPFGPNHFNRPSALYNGMIAPAQPFAIAGAIWYQGESNADRATQYASLFSDMIKDWRKGWGQGDFPFLVVQLAPFMPIQDKPMDSGWAEIRDVQLRTSRTVPNVGMAVITDHGDEMDIHPRRKDIVGERLARIAEATVYGCDDVVYSGPLYKSVEFKDGKAMVQFDHVHTGLRSKGWPLTGFTIAGDDQVFHHANAWIDGQTVVVSSPEVAKPAAVRFGWAHHPVTNLFNQEGLPASPFRTDNFDMTT